MHDKDKLDTSKWRNMIVTSLKKVQKQVQPTLTVDTDALLYLEELIFKLLYQLCSVQPHSVHDIQEQINKTFPCQIKGWALESAEAAIEKGKKKTLKLSVDKLQPVIQKEILGYKIDIQLAIYIVAVLEYISADILKLAGNYVKNIRQMVINKQDVKVAMNADKVLASMFNSEDIDNLIETQPLAKRRSLTYIDVLKDFMLCEEQFIRELNLIVKVFRKKMVCASHLFSQQDLNEIFCNIMEIYEFTTQFYDLIESTLEMSENDLLIGDLFEEMVEAAEFECYDTYTYGNVVSPTGGSYYIIKTLMYRPGVADFFKEQGIFDAVRYILPKLLYGPIHHCIDYFEYIKILMCTSPDGNDREKLGESLSALRGLQVRIEKLCSASHLKRTPENEVFYERHIGVNETNTMAKIECIQENLEGWEGKPLCQVVSVLLKEGFLTRIGKKASERKIFLFDNLMLCAKVNKHNITGFNQTEFRLKEHIYLRKVEVRDITDDDKQFSFEILQPGEPAAVFSCKDEKSKYEWLSLLMALNHRSTLDRMLDALLQEETQSIQLKTPDPSIYIFAEEDSEKNILFENIEDDSAVIKGGTLPKLIERLTYHKHADPTFVRVFLTTYRSFSNPVELLDLLIKRYDIPEPITDLSNKQVFNKEDLKKFRKEYVQPIQLRVLNVLRHWVDQHFYDFQREETLLITLEKFLSRVVRSKTARKWVESIEKIVNRRLEMVKVDPETYSFNTPPPPIEWHLTQDFDKFTILTLHPLEIGRQLTIMQSQIFRAIRPSELVGTVWTKKEKEKLSPNTLKLIRLSTLLTYWYELNIVEAHNFEERVAVYTRIIDILMVFLSLNNFNGMMEILGALNSAPVFRLQHLKAVELSPKRLQALQEAKDLTDDGHNVKYMEKLRSINPPCVPFLGVYLSNILRAEEGNPDYLSSSPEGLINFSKRRMVADITGEIQKYQNMPYNLQVEPSIRAYLESLDPLAGRSDSELNDHLYEMSLMIEPRNAKQPAKFIRKTDIPLKSPGIKPGQRSLINYRKSTSVSELDQHLPSRHLPSPTHSVSAFSFVVNGDVTDGKAEKEKKENISLPPPLLLPRAPLANEIPPEIPTKPNTLKQVNQPPDITKQQPLPRQPRRSISIQECILPPALPPRTKTIGEKTISFSSEYKNYVFPPQTPCRGEIIDNDIAVSNPAPIIPPRINQEFVRRQSEDFNTSTQLPQIPPKVSNKR
ncbi:son of sevenless homolog 2 isoform X1 [Hydra vulgaris]|uniref:son of sevenless homolog 2 isoform X1 n=1 Tax=Hydra vulgaris TaxID=6087 RepID=UPI001F5F3191|nr:son of sevenless homolog 2 [Hydra vulgaris]XP_047132930.1 son of sevenless homolog 2 [Hydra vulgaris]